MRIAALLVSLSVSKLLCHNLVVAVDHPEDFVNLLAGIISLYPTFAAKAN